MKILSFSFRSFVCAVLLGVGAVAHAGILEDDEARKAILDLRQKLEALRQTTEKQGAELAAKTNEDGTQLRRSMLDMQNQLEALRSEISKLRGANEQLARDLVDAQRKQKDVTQALDDRLKKFEPAKVTVDGREFLAEPYEKRDYEAALALFRNGDFSASQTAFVDLLTRYPQSGYRPASLFWLGNAQYATKDYKEALVNFRALVASAPDSPRIPETLLSISNCLLEVKDIKGARKALEEILKNHGASETAAAAKDRLARLK